MVVHIDLEEEETHHEDCGAQQHLHQIYSREHSLFQLDPASDNACIKGTVCNVWWFLAEQTGQMWKIIH